MPEFAFDTEREAAAKIRDAAKAAGSSLYALPFSRFDPDKSTWWLSPTSDNPAYAFGKLVVERPTVIDDGAKLIGLHVEKGVGPSAAEFFQGSQRDRNQVMQPSWTWHAFLRELRAGGVDRSMAAAADAAKGLPLVVEVVAGQILLHGDANDERPINPDAVDRVRYAWDSESLTRVPGSVARTKLRLLGDEETLTSIGDKIAAIDPLDWTWVEVLIGVPFRPVASGGLTATEVWQRACVPWLDWVK